MSYSTSQSRYKKSSFDTEYFRDVIDFSSNFHNRNELIETITEKSCSTSSTYHGPVYTIRGCPGFHYAPGAISPSDQHLLAHVCLGSYNEPPQAQTNIECIEPKPNELVVDDMTILDRAIQQPPPPTTTKVFYRSFKKLTWATLGYHYDWGARAYYPHLRSPFPPSLSNLAKFVSSALWSSTKPFTPEAAIVNYYDRKALMGGHRDDLEFTFEKPVISISVGLPCIFLLGGLKKNQAPVAILVRPGDVFSMGGESRLRFHGMSRLITADALEMMPAVDEELRCGGSEHITLKQFDFTDSSSCSGFSSSCSKEFVSDYLQTHRININVRQVVGDGQQYPEKK